MERKKASKIPKLMMFDDLKPGTKFQKVEISGKKSAPYFKIKDAWDGHGILVNAVKIRTGEPCLVGYSERVLVKGVSQVENPLSKGERK